MKYKKIKKAGTNWFLISLILAVLVFLGVLFIPKMLHGFGLFSKEAVSCGSELLNVKTQCMPQKNCVTPWMPVSEKLINADSCKAEEGYICCMLRENY